MIWLIIILLIASTYLWIYRFHIYSFLIYLSVRFEHRPKDFQLLSTLRDNLVHERKKKIAGLEMILSSWERGDEIQPKYEYFKELLEQLKELVREEKRNLMVVTRDIFLCAKLWRKLGKIEKISKKKRERVEKQELRTELTQIQNLLDQVVDKATEKFSFTLNQVVAESVKIVRVEKSQVKNIEIQEQLDDVGNTIRFSYDRFKDWQRILTNLIRNAVDAVEAKRYSQGEGVAADYSLRGGEENLWVRVSTSQTGGSQTRMSDLPNKQAGMLNPPGSSVSVIIEDSGIGMDEATRLSFFKKGFTYGKEGGLGLGVSEESVQLINKYGSWQVESQKGIGTKVTINIDKEKAQKAELILPPKKPFPRTKLAWGLSFLVLALIGLALLFAFNKYSRFWVDWNPAFAEAKENYLIVKNKSNEMLWDVFLPAPIMLSAYTQKPVVEFVDLDGDGKTEVLVAIRYTARTTGKVICYSYKKEKLWEFACGEGGIYPTAEGVNSQYFFPKLVEAEDLNGDSKKEIIVSSGEVRWFPNQLAVLDYKGNKISEYWHPGIMDCLYCLDFDNDGEKEIILGGINNRMDWCPVISVLNSKRTFGQAMPYLAVKQIEKAKEEWYIVLPHIKKSIPDESKWESLLPAVDNMEILSEENRIDVYVTDGRLYSLTSNFKLNYYYLQLVHFLQWKHDRQFAYELTREDSASWGNIEVWKDGVKIR